MSNYFKSIKSTIKKSNINNILYTLDYNRIDTKDFLDIIEIATKNQKQVTLDTIKHIIEHSNNFIKTFKQYNDNEIYELIYNYNDEELLDIVEYFIDKNHINIFVIDIILNDGKFINNNSFFNSIKDHLNILINKEFDYIDELINDSIIYAFNKNILFNSDFVKFIVNKKGILDELYDRFDEYEINDIKNIFIIDKLIRKNKTFDYISNQIDDEYFEDIIYKYINKILGMKNFIEIYSDHKQFFKEYEKYLNNRMFKNYSNIIVDYYSYINDLQNDELTNLINYENNNYKDIMQRIVNIKNSDISIDKKIDKISILLIKFFNSNIIKNISKFNNLQFTFNKTNFILLTAVLNINKIVNNIDNLNLSDKSRYKLLLDIKKMDKSIFKQVYDKSYKELKNIQETINCIDL